ncbi:MAG: Spy/CpxP family protein refolding chaperone [Gemmatimonadales bacterium]
MRVSILGALTLMAAAGPLAGQAGRRPGGPEELLRMREQLGLTDQQVEQLRAARASGVSARRERMGTLMELQSRRRAGEITQDKFRAEVQRMRRDRPTRPDRSRILTEDQQGKLRQLRTAERGRMRAMQRRGARFAPRGGFDQGRVGPGPRGFDGGRVRQGPGGFNRDPDRRGQGGQVRPGRPGQVLPPDLRPGRPGSPPAPEV